MEEASDTVKVLKRVRKELRHLMGLLD
jgi:hypothetical protein